MYRSINLLSGKVQARALLSFNGSSYLGIAYLCGVGLSPCLHTPALAPAPVRRNKASLSLVQIVLMSVGLFLAFKFGSAVLLIMRFVEEGNEVEINLGKGGKIVMSQGSAGAPTSKELLNAIRLVRKKHIIGEGGYGVVYKLDVEDHPPLAVKKLKTCLESERTFENELDTLETVKHRNLVKLRGFCTSPSLKLLIFDFVPGGNRAQLRHVWTIPCLMSTQLSPAGFGSLTTVPTPMSETIIDQNLKQGIIVAGDAELDLLYAIGFPWIPTNDHR